MKNLIMNSEWAQGPILAGMVYVMTNSANKNEIVAFRRVQNGTLTPLGFYSTYGLGTGPRKVSPARRITALTR